MRVRACAVWKVLNSVGMAEMSRVGAGPVVHCGGLETLEMRLLAGTGFVGTELSTRASAMVSTGVVVDWVVKARRLDGEKALWPG